jgi:hypothetical protein
MLINPHCAFHPAVGMLAARELRRTRGLELPDRRLYVPDRRIRLPARDRRPGLRRAITVTSINTATGGASITSLALSVPGTVAAGNLVIVPVQSGQNGNGTVSDTQSNSYTLLTSVHPDNTGTSGTTQLFYSSITTRLTSSDTITYSTGGSRTSIAASACYATGIATSSPVDVGVTKTATGNGGHMSPASVTGAGSASQSGELWVGVLGVASAVTYTNSGSGTWATTPAAASGSTETVGGGSQVNAGTTALTYTATLSSAAAWALIIVAFAPVTDVLMPQILM